MSARPGIVMHYQWLRGLPRLFLAGLLSSAWAAGATGQAGCTGAEVLREAGCLLQPDAGAVSFRVSSSGGGSINRLTITPAGLAADNREVSMEVDGVVTGAEIADLDANGWPEVYVYITSAGSGSYGSLVAYAVNNGRSMSQVYLAPLSEDPRLAAGYMGHDEFALVENRLVRRFPVYLPGDSNNQPSGGTRQLQYRLSPGEAGWILSVDQVAESGG